MDESAKHYLTSIPTSTYSATTKSAKKFIFWLATQSASLSLETDIGSLMMTLKPDFQQISRKELRTYVLTHREDAEALRIYMGRSHNEPGVIRQSGGLNEKDLNLLEQLIKTRVGDR